MLVTLSERHLSERIRELEGINDTVEEITYRMEHYAKRLFVHVNEFGLRFSAMIEQHGGLATIQLDISGVGRNWEDGDWHWSKPYEGLACLDPVAVSIEESDMAAICEGPIATMAVDTWGNYAAELQRISVSEIRPKIEAVLLRLHTQPLISETADPALNYELSTAQLHRAGLRNPLERFEAQEAYRQAQEAEYASQQQAAHEAMWGEGSGR